MKIYNTLTRRKEEFAPINGNEINFFVCGPTVYDYSHLGHAKTYTQFDFIVRYLRYLGYEVYYLQNITDIDNKIIKRAKETNVDWRQLSKKYEKLHLKDMKRLNNTSVTKYAPASGYIKEIVKQVEILLDKGYAYKIDDGIYFETSKFPDYGKLSGRTKLGKSDSVSRIDENSQKRGWNDFCLWKFSKPNEPSWETEIGKGRPGWHIEDTAITEKFFGPQYDMHGGAEDLIIPHHEAEIAQMESISGKKPLVKYWMHTAFLKVNGAKMSKSLGNFYTIDDIVKKGFDPLSLRYLFLGAHYRDTLNFTWDSLSAAQNGLEKLRARVVDLKSETTRTVLSEEKQKKIDEFRSDFRRAMDDDINTPKALAAVWSMLKSNIPSVDKLDLLFDFDEVLGFNLRQLSNTEVQTPDKIKALIEKRETLRKEGKWREADKLRAEIEKAGYKIEDASAGPRVKKA